MLDGTFRPDRHGDREAAQRALGRLGGAGATEAPAPMPQPPRWLSAGAKAFWRSVGPELHRLGILDEPATLAFAGVCVNVGRMEELRQLLDEHGDVYVDGRGNPRRRPESRMYHTAAAQYLRDAMEWGLTPAGRARLGLPPGPTLGGDFS